MQGMNEKEIEDILVEAGLISIKQLKEYRELAAATGEKIEKILLSEGLINYKEIQKLLAKRLGTEFVDLEKVIVNKNAVSKLDGETVRKYNVFPFDIRDNFLYLAMQTPDDVFLLDDLKLFARMEIKPFLGDHRLIGKAISYFYPNEKSDSEGADDIPGPSLEVRDDDEDKSFEVNQLEVLIDQDRGFNDEFIRNIIMKAIKMDASDIHVDLWNQDLRIRYRVDGRLIVEDMIFSGKYEEFTARVKIMAGLFTCDRNVPQRGRILFEVNKTERISLHVLMLPALGGDKILFKLEKSNRHMVLEEIGLTAIEQEQVKSMLKRKCGMLVISGPGGSGRTTTCYTLLKKIISDELNVVTVECEALERLEGISQVQVLDRLMGQLHAILEAVLECDPDVVFVDMELNSFDLRLLMDAALAGKLVIITMNFNNVFETLSGLLNMGFEPYRVTSAVEGIITQSLLRKSCPKCKHRRKDLGGQRNHPPCICNDTGYKGKVALFEVFSMSKEYRKIILKGNGMEELEQRLERETSTFKNNCLRLVNEEETSIDEIIRLGIGKDLLSF